MAVATALNVISMSANADVLSGRSLCIKGIKLVPATGAPAHFKLRQGGSGGIVLYEAMADVSSPNPVDWAEVALEGSADLYLEIVAGTGTLYLYSE